MSPQDAPPPNAWPAVVHAAVPELLLHEDQCLAGGARDGAGEATSTLARYWPRRSVEAQSEMRGPGKQMHARWTSNPYERELVRMRAPHPRFIRPPPRKMTSERAEGRDRSGQRSLRRRTSPPFDSDDYHFTEPASRCECAKWPWTTGSIFVASAFTSGSFASAWVFLSSFSVASWSSTPACFTY